MIRAVIFDLDGTVLDNEGVWEDIFRQVAERNNVPGLDLHGWLHESGIGIRTNWKKLLTTDKEVERLTALTHQLYSEQTASQEVVVREGLIELVEDIKTQGWQTALATSSEWHTVEDQLTQLDLHLAFDVTTTGEEVLAPKPDPEIYTLTAQKLGLEPENCVVIEDAIAGVQAAREAGCKVVGITSERITKKMHQAAGADFVVDSMTEVMLMLRQYGDKDVKKQSQDNPQTGSD